MRCKNLYTQTQTCACACSVCLVWPFRSNVQSAIFSPSFFLSVTGRSMSILCICMRDNTSPNFFFLSFLSFFSFALTHFMYIHSPVRQLKRICTRPSTVDAGRGYTIFLLSWHLCCLLFSCECNNFFFFSSLCVLFFSSNTIIVHIRSRFLLYMGTQCNLSHTF
jgi:hypothetical protein